MPVGFGEVCELNELECCDEGVVCVFCVVLLCVDGEDVCAEVDGC